MSDTLPREKADFVIAKREVLVSYVLRIAAYLRADADNFIRQLVGRRENLSQMFWRHDIVPNLSAITGENEPALRASQFSTDKQSGDIAIGDEHLPRQYLDFNYRRVCPSAFNAAVFEERSPVHEKDWMLTHMVVSPGAQTLLSSTCTHCSSPLTWSTAVHVDRCNTCGGKLWLQSANKLQGRLRLYDELLREVQVVRSFADQHCNTVFCSGHLLSGIDRLELMDALVVLNARVTPGQRGLDLLESRIRALQAMAAGPEAIVKILHRVGKSNLGNNFRLTAAIAHGRLQTSISEVSNSRSRGLLTHLSKQV